MSFPDTVSFSGRKAEAEKPVNYLMSCGFNYHPFNLFLAPDRYLVLSGVLIEILSGILGPMNLNGKNKFSSPLNEVRIFFYSECRQKENTTY